jgi:hypothetical protein
LADAGYRLKVIQAVGGWLTPEMAMRYDSPANRKEREAIDSLPSPPEEEDITKVLTLKKKKALSRKGLLQ